MAQGSWDVKLNLEDREARNKIRNIQNQLGRGLETSLRGFATTIGGGRANYGGVTAGIAAATSAGVTKGLLAAKVAMGNNVGGLGTVLTAGLTFAIGKAIAAGVGKGRKVFNKKLFNAYGGRYGRQDAATDFDPTASNFRDYFTNVVKSRQVENLARNMSPAISSRWYGRRVLGGKDISGMDTSRAQMAESLGNAYPKRSVMGEAIGEAEERLSKSGKLVSNFGQALRVFGKDIGGFQGGLLRLAGTFSNVGGVVAGFGRAVIGLAPVIGGVVLAFSTLATVMGSIQNVAIQMARPFLEAGANMESLRKGVDMLATDKGLSGRIEKLAKLPGISIEGAFDGANRMLSSGLEEAKIEKYIVGFSKITKSAEDYKRTMNTIGQILNKDTLSAEEIRGQLGDSTVGLNRLLNKEFGTANAEDLVKQGIDPKQFLDRLVSQIEKSGLEAPVGTIQNALDNFDDSALKLRAAFGKGLAVGAVPFLDNLTTKIDELVESGQLEAWGERLSTIFNSSAFDTTVDSLILMADIGTKFFQSMTHVMNGFVEIGSAINNIFNQIGMAINSIKLPDWLGVVIAGLSSGTGLIGVASGLIQQNIHKPKGTSPGFGSISSGIESVIDKAINTLSDSTKSPEASRQIQILEEIADNTRPDINRAVFGGGNIGQLGITQTELAGTKKKRGNVVINAKVRDGFDLLADGLADYTAMMVKGY